MAFAVKPEINIFRDKKLYLLGSIIMRRTLTKKINCEKSSFKRAEIIKCTHTVYENAAQFVKKNNISMSLIGNNLSHL